MQIIYRIVSYCTQLMLFFYTYADRNWKRKHYCLQRSWYTLVGCRRGLYSYVCMWISVVLSNCISCCWWWWWCVTLKHRRKITNYFWCLKRIDNGNIGLKLHVLVFFFVILQACYLNLKKLNHAEMCRQLDKFSKEIRKQVFIVSNVSLLVGGLFH